MTATPAEAPARSRLSRLRASLEPAEWRRAGAMAIVIAGLHLVGFVTLLAVVVPEHYALGGSGVFGVAIGTTAYALGLRHAFDADHIAAIDNATRKFMADGKRPLSVGFFFSLGHSTVVFALALLLGLGVKALAGQVESEGSALHGATGLIGAAVSGTFLYLIGIVNLILLVGVVRVFRRMRGGDYDAREMERRLESRGMMNRFYRRFTRSLREPWQMYPLGVLFGLGFDTATEVALLFLAAGAAVGGIPWYAILCLPILFAAGMSLLDPIDGCFMSFAYGWAFAEPVRRVYYNITITGLSVAVALIIGTVELASVIGDRLKLEGGVWDLVAGVDLNSVGFVVVGLFVATWAIALAVWHFGRIERRWAADGGAAGRSSAE